MDWGDDWTHVSKFIFDPSKLDGKWSPIQINDLLNNGTSLIHRIIGGTTPSPVYRRLASMDVNWGKCNFLWEMIDVFLLEVKDVI